MTVSLDAALPGNPGPRPWRCEVVLCLHKPGWWLSIHGVLNCLNCCPPSSPELVVKRGTNDDAPLIAPGQSTTPLGWARPKQDLLPRSGNTVTPAKKTRKSTSRTPSKIGR